MLIHEKLKCYQMSLFVSKEANRALAKKMPKGYAYLNDQLKRALASIVLNIAEGVYRKSSTERKRFFEIAIGSASESSAVFDLLFSFNLISKALHSHFKDQLLQIVRMLYKMS
ncbi:MAG: four helix bundle protein [Pseudomonadota bacterium]